MREQLYRKLTTELHRRLPAASKPQVQNLALLTQSLVFSENCHLSNLALQLPIDGRRDSLIQRPVRFLGNCRVTRGLAQAARSGFLQPIAGRWPVAVVAVLRQLILQCLHSFSKSDDRLFKQRHDRFFALQIGLVYIFARRHHKSGHGAIVPGCQPSEHRVTLT